MMVSVGALAELGPVWRSLPGANHPGAAFRSHAWISAWWQAFGDGCEPLVLVARDADGAVRAILPLYLEPLPLGGQQVRLMGDRHVGSDYLGVAGDEACAPDLVGFVRALGPAEIHLSEMLDVDPLARALGGEVTPRYPCPAIRIGDGDFAAYLAGLPDGAGKQFLRRRRWLERQPGHRVEILAGEAGMDTLFDLHRRRWALEGGSDGITTPAVEAFHRVAARGLGAVAQTLVLHVDGAPRAALYGFDSGERFAFYQAGHDPEWRPRSVGTVVLGLAIERAFRASKREFDFLHGNESYKLAWANHSRHTIAVSARSPGLRPWLRQTGRSLDAAARTLAKKMLPPDVVAWLRQRGRMAARV